MSVSNVEPFFSADRKLPKYIEEEILTRINDYVDSRRKEYFDKDPDSIPSINELVEQFIEKSISENFIDSKMPISDELGDSNAVFMTTSRDAGCVYMVVQRDVKPDDIMDETFYGFGSNWGVTVYRKFEMEQPLDPGMLLYRKDDSFFVEDVKMQEAVLVAMILRDERNAVSEIENYLREQ